MFDEKPRGDLAAEAFLQESLAQPIDSLAIDNKKTRQIYFKSMPPSPNYGSGEGPTPTRHNLSRRAENLCTLSTPWTTCG